MSKVGMEYIESSERKCFNVAAASLLLACGTPVVVATAAVLRPELKGYEAIFQQRRIGRHQRPISIFKLRTFIEQDFDASADTFGCDNPHASDRAKLVRRVGIDEIPQAINVLRGEMSIFGIRPQIESVLEQRQKIDSKLFSDWYEWYQVNIGLLGPGQNYAHAAGPYAENSEIVRNVMMLDIKGSEEATMHDEIKQFITMPWRIINDTVKSTLGRVEDTTA